MVWLRRHTVCGICATRVVKQENSLWEKEFGGAVHGRDTRAGPQPNETQGKISASREGVSGPPEQVSAQAPIVKQRSCLVFLGHLIILGLSNRITSMAGR